MTSEAPDCVAVNVATGEILEHLDRQPPETLAEALDAIRVRQAEMKRWESAIESELGQRLKARGNKLVVFGDWEVELPIRRESVWDAEELEQVMQSLVEDGTVAAGDLTGIVTREPVVARSKAKELAGRLIGEAKAAVNACCTWKEKPGKLTVVRSVQLDAGTERTPLVGSHAPRDSSAQITSQVPAGSSGSPTDLDPEELFKE